MPSSKAEDFFFYLSSNPQKEKLKKKGRFYGIRWWWEVVCFVHIPHLKRIKKRERPVGFISDFAHFFFFYFEILFIFFFFYLYGGSLSLKEKNSFFFESEKENVGRVLLIDWLLFVQARTHHAICLELITCFLGTVFLFTWAFLKYIYIYLFFLLLSPVAEH
jgi:hypothetical protein